MKITAANGRSKKLSKRCDNVILGSSLSKHRFHLRKAKKEKRSTATSVVNQDGVSRDQGLLRPTLPYTALQLVRHGCDGPICQ